MIQCPSGDQLGCPTIGPPKKVMRTGLEPSAFETHTSREPDREDIKAISLPSGEYFGVWSTQVEEMKSSAEFGGPPFLGNSARQIFVSSIWREYTRWWPREISETSSVKG